MVAFSHERREGRALEHALSGDRRDAIRMLDERSGKWLTPVASDKGIFVLIQN